MRRAIIVGASSGLGLELAKVMARDGWSLGLAARNMDALEILSKELGTDVHLQRLDVTRRVRSPRPSTRWPKRSGGLTASSSARA